MKLINHTLWILSLIIFTTVGLWAFLFYSQLLNQVKTTIDEGLSNHKIAIIDKLKDDAEIPNKDSFQDKSYSIRNVNEDYALQIIDSYKDTLMYSSLKKTSYQARMLTTAFVSPNGQFYEMKVISHEIDKENLIKKIITSLLLLFLFLAISIFLVNRFVLKNTWKPFYEILNYLNDFRLDKRKEREFQKTNIQEFELLNKSVQNLLNKNVEIFKSQKEFIENASHEFQTPLAIGINKLELLAEDQRLSEEQTQKIGQIIDSFQRLSGLNKSLLLLSKIENKQFISIGKVSFDSIIKRILEDFSDYSSFQEIKISYQKEADLVFTMNRDLAETLVLNLIKNAIIHNHKEGEIVIRLTASSLMVENTSVLPQIAEEKIFKRFSKSTNNNKSTGLGLSIVKAIAEVSGLEVSYSYTGKHVFILAKKV
ncbi:HAMP domain-containing sensor histidine kinase [uncultured Arcticibacterium sp.]|uniref:sensor histidine kinase n=1 Tax=uncultured Arcticibacterium sp. TaxID=2173042 RepID=UPI0030FB8EB0